jgi:exodeoxyribonuclease-3
LTNANHTDHGLAHGAERHPTWCNHKRADRPFHLDYCFIPQAWTPHLRGVTVGRHAEWMAWSDHCPLVVEVGI